MVDDPPWWRAPAVIAALGALAVVVVADAVLKSLGGAPSDFSLFVGRLHPLAVHLPIGIVLLVGAAEAATLSPRLRSRLDPAIALALPVLVLTTVGAFVLGHLLGRAGDFSPKALLAHRRAEFFATLGICLCPVVWAYQERTRTAAARLAYRGVLGLTIAVLSLGAHFGGTLSRGESYLGRYAPGPLKGLLGGGEAKPVSSASARSPRSEPRLFADVIQPILDARCASCHGAEKSKGGLRLDSLAAILKGGEEDGPALIAFDPKRSPLLARVLLPKAHEDHMPPEDKPQPTPSELAALSFWIERGGGDTLLVRDLLLPAEARSVLEQALTKAAKSPASGETTRPPASSAPPDAAPSAKTPTAVAASGAPTAPALESAPSEPTPREPSAAPRPGDDEPGTAPPPERTPSAGASSASGILAERCAKCHGPSKQKAKLRVDSLDSLLRGGKSGPAVVPGDPSASSLLKAVRAPLDDDAHMPPKKEPQLTPQELAVLTAWIRGLKATPRASSPGAASAADSAPAPLPDSVPDSASAPGRAPSPSPATALDSTPEPAAAPVERPSAELLAGLPSRLALFPTRVMPLLSEHCELCHDASSLSGGLSVESHAALLTGGDSGPTVVPGNPEASELVRRINLPKGDDDRMPPEGNLELSADDIALVAAWVQHDGTERGEAELARLPAAAVRAIAAHPPARAKDDVTRATPHVERGGCGACRLGPHGEPPDFALVAASALALGAALRRYQRRAST